MKLKECTIRKANRTTIKDPATGNYDMHEADISLTVEAEEGKLNELEVIERVKQLVQITLNDEPNWMNRKQDVGSISLEKVNYA